MKIEKSFPVGLLLAPAIFRILPCFNAFWFDEIWSWQISRLLTSPLQILTNPLAQSDNNHPLNTLWMYIVGDTSSWWIYRLPALLSGCALVFLILKMERAIHRWATLTVLLLVGLSFPLITYSSEARGYAPMLLCAVAAYYLLRSTRKPRFVLFSLVSIAGLLFHLTFIYFLLAALAFTLAQKQFRRLILFLPAALGLLIYAWIFLRHLTIGGAADTSAIHTIVTFLSLMLGGPKNNLFTYLVTIVSVTCIVRAWIWTRRRSMPEAIFFLVAITLAPALAIVSQYISPETAPSVQLRYLLVPFIFSLILVMRYLAAALDQRSLGRWLAITILSLATLGNGYHLGRFLAVGRGDYRAAVVHMAAATDNNPITWGSDNDANIFRAGKILAYYQRFLPPGRALVRSNHPEWLIFNIQGESPAPLTIQSGDNLYRLNALYPAYGLSGWTWVLYKKT